jgi:LemA protein
LLPSDVGASPKDPSDPQSGEPRRIIPRNPMNLILLILLGALVFVVVALGLYVAGAYNALVTLRNRFKNAFSQIDVQLKRRYDLIPNLVETCKAFMKHESTTLEAVVAARGAAMNASSRVAANPADPEAMKQLLAAEQALGSGLGRLLAVAESYPDLKANQNMLGLQEELTSTENKVSFARQAFNDAVTEYNTRRESFPTNLIAGLFQFAAAELWQVDAPEERKGVRVSF